MTQWKSSSRKTWAPKMPAQGALRLDVCGIEHPDSPDHVHRSRKVPTAGVPTPACRSARGDLRQHARVSDPRWRARIVEWERSGRAELVLYVLAPLAVFWLLAIVGPARLSLGERLLTALALTAVFGPLLYLRTRR